METLARILIGGLGGLTASLSKILALDATRLGSLFNSGSLTEMNELLASVYVFTPILILLGAIVGWASGETHRVKLLAIGCAAPALLAPWTVGDLGSAATPLVASLNPIGPAYAQTDTFSAQQNDFLTGIGVLLGLEDTGAQRYWVIVKSDENFIRAQKYAAALNEAVPSIKAFVGSRMPDNQFYPVIVGGPTAYLPYKAALELKARALSLDVVSDAYLSSYADRRPLVIPET
jgi:hypothetical protein